MQLRSIIKSIINHYRINKCMTQKHTSYISVFGAESGCQFWNIRYHYLAHIAVHIVLHHYDVLEPRKIDLESRISEQTDCIHAFSHRFLTFFTLQHIFGYAWTEIKYIVNLIALLRFKRRCVSSARRSDRLRSHSSRLVCSLSSSATPILSWENV